MTLVAGSLKQLRGPCFARPPLSNIIHASQRSRPISQASSQAPGPISSLIPFVQGIIGTHTQQQLDKPQGGSRDQVPAEDLAELTPIPTTTLACRAALLAVAVAAGVWHVEADAAVQRVWDSMRASPWVQWDTFEPSLVVVTFMASMAVFWALDVPLKQHTRRWRLNEDEESLQEAWRWSNVTDRLVGETLLYIVPLAVFDLAFPRRHLPEIAPSFSELCLEVLLALFLYDLFFTFGHMACHRFPWLYKIAHKKHHSTSNVYAIDTVRLTPGEEALDVACSIAALNLLGAHPMSRCIYDVLIVYLLTELHSGYSAPWMLQDVVPGGLWAGSRRHDEHHRAGSVYYQKFFCWIDNTLGYVRK